jgi:hypothetical protein
MIKAFNNLTTGQWKWAIYSRNGRLICESAEQFVSYDDAQQSFQDFLYEIIPLLKIEVK